ncbi:MAG: CvpA family protein [Candidatus Omnitrophica bacterium]|nr:CvpA family protein [Candidatus Omnitrophota bacterium]
MPHIRFNWVDVLFVTLLIRICYIAFKRGFLPELFRSLGLLTAFMVSFNNYASLGSFISTYTRWTGARPGIISFLFIFIAALFIFKILSIVAGVFLGGKDASVFNRSIALALGLGRGLLLTSLIYILLVNSPFEYLSKSVRDRSFSGSYVLNVAVSVYRNCINFYPGGESESSLGRLLEKS